MGAFTGIDAVSEVGAGDIPTGALLLVLKLSRMFLFLLLVLAMLLLMKPLTIFLISPWTI